MSASITFSVIVVCKDAGEKLLATVKSAMSQTYPHFEVLVKDGMSAEDPHITLAEVLQDAAPYPALRILVSQDAGIYDAMNQAVAAASGDYLLFLNCGDSFASPDVLAKTAAYLGEHPDVLLPYGHRINGMTGVLEYAPQAITPFILFRGLPCHQACFYHKSLFAERGYDTKYRVRADYEHFFYCYYSGVEQAASAGSGDAGQNANSHAAGGSSGIRLMDFPVCVYEGGGFSETPANLKVSAKEHREICSRYFAPFQHFKYRLWLIVTLQPLRKKLADSKSFGALYQNLKQSVSSGKTKSDIPNDERL